ncbi:hypothetical protein [Streptomyces purpureus]|uniref:Uncharacterized protein n=2 Tax=Streptomyces purpureus TaxID=1951 RepID=A0A918HGK2_9ACTN|nr:hypothetical protein [Streptomyces purpureus]GGT63361.1 hypothetical protein GCM10014713_65800 [Streptomyces purpureus]
MMYSATSTRFADTRHTDALDDFLLPAPDARTRLPYALAPADQRRVDLHAALTAAGIPPGLGDASAIDALSDLDTTTVSAVIRWINCGVRLGSGRADW